MHQELADLALCFLSRSVTRGRYPFRFQAAEHALHWRVVPAISPATHALTHSITPEPLAKKTTRILYSSSDWRSFLKANNLIASMSRRGNCHDNAVAESFFQLLKQERIKRKIYTTRQDARGDVFDYIKMFYNPKRRHSFNNQLSPVEFEMRYTASLESV